MMERFHRRPGAALISWSNPSQWAEFLLLVVLERRTVVETDSRCSAAELVSRKSLRL